MSMIEEPVHSTTAELASLPRSHAWAVELQDDEGGRLLPVSRPRTVLGGARTADVLIHDASVSGVHCALTVLGSGLAIEDLGSRNGTFVGGARVKEAWVGVGATFTIGRATLTCLPVDDDDYEDDDLAPPLPGIAGASTPMRRVAAKVRRLAAQAAPVLIAGESGTGKELIARALHQQGPRAKSPFVAINVAALPKDLVESEMFGHERGAFTGATMKRAGAFADADSGTLFLDEIGELPLEAQPKLLRALDGYEVRRVGAVGGGHCADVRVVAATHAPLEERVTSGAFRRDLFHRLEVFVIELPPLRARRGDIAPVARHLLRSMAHEVGARELTSGAVARLVAHDWPGNVRELRNVLYRAADFARSRGTIDAHDIARSIRVRDVRRVRLTAPLAKALLVEHGGNLSAAARAAGYPRTTFRKLLSA